MNKEKYSLGFILIAVGFIACLLTSNIISVKMISAWGWIMPAGTIIFPVSYIFGDVLTEVYGYKKTRLVIWLGFAANVLMVTAIAIAQVIPAAFFWDGQESWNRILGFAPRLLAASFVAYIFGEFANSFVLSKMKILTNGRWLWTRTTGSTLVGQGIDSLIFVSIAFVGTMPSNLLVSAIITQWIVKSAYEIVATPLTYVIVGYLKRQEGLEIYDRGISYNPFGVSSN